MATEVTKEQITELYIAYYDRAPDSTGLDYWLNSTQTIEQMAQSFAQQDETKAKYPDTLSTTEYVNTIYQNVYNREADATGLAYWVNALDSGLVSRGDMIIAIVNGATGDDQKVLDNKVVVGIAYADAGLDGYDNAVSIMDGISSDPYTVVSAIDQINEWSNAGDGVNFTEDRDTLVGTDADDTFEGVVDGTTADNKDTYQGFDGVHGGDGTDTLHITSKVTGTIDRTIGAPKVSAVEILQVTQDAYTGVVVDPTNFDSSFTKVVADSSVTSNGNITLGTGTIGDGSSMNNIVNAELSMQNHKSLIINYTDAIVAGGYDEMEVTLTNKVEQRLEVNSESTANAIETYTVHTTTASQSLTIVDGANTTIYVDGSGSLTLTSATANKIDASKSTGQLNFTSVVAGTEIIGSHGDDIIGGTVSGTVEGGGGADEITMSANNVALYRDHSDSVRGGEDSLKGFTVGGNDINVSEAVKNSTGGNTGANPDAAKFDASAKAMSENDAYIATSTAGSTHIHVDTTGGSGAQVAYIDVNQDNKFNATEDLVIKIDADATLTNTDFIV
jgi:hypothetical protein